MAVSPSTRRLVRERAVFRCEYCHADERWQYVRFTMDHVVPQSEQGCDDADNLVLACRNCNERRSNCCQAVDPRSGETVAIFNPRTDGWGRLPSSPRRSRCRRVVACTLEVSGTELLAELGPSQIEHHVDQDSLPVVRIGSSRRNLF
jgi:hypothetical protein